MAAKQTLDVNGTKVDVSNLEKIFYPKARFTKGDVIDYYVRVSSFLLPHLKERPITLKRYPDGVEGFFFYEKKCPDHRPKWIKTTKVAKSEGGEINYCVINDLPSLIWAANLADLELHTFLHRAPAILRPTTIAFDLDPGPPADIVLCCKVCLVRSGWRALPRPPDPKGCKYTFRLTAPLPTRKPRRFPMPSRNCWNLKRPRLSFPTCKKVVVPGKCLSIGARTMTTKRP